KYNKFDLEILLHQNVIYGCTMMINKKLLMELLDKIPVEFLNHDHYVAIIAKILGNIYYLDYKSILYRQHGNNVSGTINKTLLEKLKDKETYIKNIELFAYINNFILKNYVNELDQNQKKILIQIQFALKKSKLKSLVYLIKNKIRKNTIKGSVRFWIEFYIWKNSKK
ncbi:MAG: hypothetical protein ACRC0G_03865, partial [Fusobacteriaceae bacterium]